MEYEKDQQLILTDKTDGKKYTAKVLQVDDKKKELKVHYVGWSPSYD